MAVGVSLHVLHRSKELKVVEKPERQKIRFETRNERTGKMTADDGSFYLVKFDVGETVGMLVGLVGTKLGWAVADGRGGQGYKVAAEHVVAMVTEAARTCCR